MKDICLQYMGRNYRSVSPSDLRSTSAGTCVSSNSIFLLLCACLHMPANGLKNVMSIDFGVTNKFQQQAVQFAYTESISNRIHCYFSGL